MGAIAADLLLFFLVFGMSATTDIADVRKQLRNRNALLTGISLQFIITLLVVTSSPGGSYSNWYVLQETVLGIVYSAITSEYPTGELWLWGQRLFRTTEKHTAWRYGFG
jgi:predicted Na+-dependent transporter